MPAAETQQSVRQTAGGALQQTLQPIRRWGCGLCTGGAGSFIRCHLGAGGSFPAALQSNKHDDVVLSFSGSPGLHTRIHQLNNTQYIHVIHTVHTAYKHTVYIHTEYTQFTSQITEIKCSILQKKFSHVI